MQPLFNEESMKIIRNIFKEFKKQEKKREFDQYKLSNNSGENLKITKYLK